MTRKTTCPTPERVVYGEHNLDEMEPELTRLREAGTVMHPYLCVCGHFHLCTTEEQKRLKAEARRARWEQIKPRMEAARAKRAHYQAQLSAMTPEQRAEHERRQRQVIVAFGEGWAKDKNIKERRHVDSATTHPNDPVILAALRSQGASEELVGLWYHSWPLPGVRLGRWASKRWVDQHQREHQQLLRCVEMLGEWAGMDTARHIQRIDAVAARTQTWADAASLVAKQSPDNKPLCVYARACQKAAREMRMVGGVGLDVRSIPAAVKRAVWKRDGGQCRWCGSTVQLEYDHIHPHSKGGSSSDVDNIQLLCRLCNVQKSDRTGAAAAKLFPAR